MLGSDLPKVRAALRLWAITVVARRVTPLVAQCWGMTLETAGVRRPTRRQRWEEIVRKLNPSPRDPASAGLVSSMRKVSDRSWAR